MMHQNLYYSSLNLLIRQNIFGLFKNTSSDYQNKFNGHLEFYRIKIAFYQQCFHILPSLLRNVGK